VQIAFANEVALLCERCGSDVYTVRRLVRDGAKRDMHVPGAGVGGHCIPKDPWLLIAGAGEDLPLRVIPAARAVNDSMPAARGRAGGSRARRARPFC
jgi:UDP-N-acetyl-D-mannosaminuronic acid dehydrogenase